MLRTRGKYNAMCFLLGMISFASMTTSFAAVAHAAEVLSFNAIPATDWQARTELLEFSSSSLRVENNSIWQLPRTADGQGVERPSSQ